VNWVAQLREFALKQHKFVGFKGGGKVEYLVDQQE
jgi:acetyl/propionyl-CoA carboxylase alpha subunit